MKGRNLISIVDQRTVLRVFIFPLFIFYSALRIYMTIFKNYTGCIVSGHAALTCRQRMLFRLQFYPLLIFIFIPSFELLSTLTSVIVQSDEMKEFTLKYETFCIVCMAFFCLFSMYWSYRTFYAMFPIYIICMLILFRLYAFIIFVKY